MQVDTSSEAWRHECEVRHVVQLPASARAEYLAKVKDKRPPAASAQLVEAVVRALAEAEK